MWQSRNKTHGKLAIEGKSIKISSSFLSVRRYLELSCISCEIFIDVIFYRCFKLK